MKTSKKIKLAIALSLSTLMLSQQVFANIYVSEQRDRPSREDANSAAWVQISQPKTDYTLYELCQRNDLVDRCQVIGNGAYNVIDLNQRLSQLDSQVTRTRIAKSAVSIVVGGVVVTAGVAVTIATGGAFALALGAGALTSAATYRGMPKIFSSTDNSEAKAKRDTLNLMSKAYDSEIILEREADSIIGLTNDSKLKTFTQHLMQALDGVPATPLDQLSQK